MGGDEDVKYTAGLAGFIVFFVLAVALWLLVRNMNGRLRRMRYYAEQEEAAQAAADQASTTVSAGGGSAVPPSHSPAPEPPERTGPPG